MSEIALQPRETVNAAEQLAARIMSGSMTLDELAQIAETSLAAQNAIARVRVYAERQIAQQYLFAVDEYERADVVTRLSERGWSRSRIEQAQRFAQLELPQIDAVCAAHTAGGRETTSLAVKQLLPTIIRDRPTGSADVYSSPPVDIQISRAFGVHEDDARAQQIADSLTKALRTTPNPRHAFIWSKYHGIQDDGSIGDSYRFSGIAQLMSAQSEKPVTREYVEAWYYRADSHVFRSMYRDLLGV